MKKYGYWFYIPKAAIRDLFSLESQARWAWKEHARENGVEVDINKGVVKVHPAPDITDPETGKFVDMSHMRIVRVEGEVVGRDHE